jgi:ABC-type glycerol-3-phosphate transport system permease component
LIALAVPIYFIFLALENAFPALREFGLRGSTLALAILYASFAMPLCVWLMRSAFRAVPLELEESAFVEGATRAVTFRRITLPLAAPSILVAALVAFLLAYSEFALAWLFATKEENETLAMELAGAQIGFYATEWGPTAAHALLMTIPVVLVFLALQRLLLRANLASTATD